MAYRGRTRVAEVLSKEPSVDSSLQNIGQPVVDEHISQDRQDAVAGVGPVLDEVPSQVQNTVLVEPTNEVVASNAETVEAEFLRDERKENLKEVAKAGVTTADAGNVELREMSDLDFIKDASIIARPLMLPETLKIKAKDPHYVYRWINWKGAGGTWFRKMKLAGFIPARVEDLHEHHAEVDTSTGNIVMGDLMLMKIQREVYGGMIKHNFQRAMVMSQHAAVHRQAAEEGYAHIEQTTGAPESYIKDKVKYYIPDREEATKIFKD